MDNLTQKIQELEAKHKKALKAEKAGLMQKYRLQEKKKKEASEKKFLETCLKYRKLINDDILFFGGCQNVVNAVNMNDEKSQQKLQYFRGLVQAENNVV